MNHKMKRLRLILLTTLLLTFSVVCRAGWVISEKITDNYGNSSVQTTFIQKNHIRYESASSISILNLDDRLITIIFPNLRAYWQGSTSDLTTSMMEAYDSQVQSLVLSLPQDQQAKFQQMYDTIKMKMLHPDTTAVASRLTLKKTAQHDSIQGFAADEYLILRDSVATERFWITFDTKPYQEIDAGRFVELKNGMNPYSRQGTLLDSKPYLELLQNGLIVKSDKLSGEMVLETTVVTQIKESNIPMDFFFPPSNYRKVSLTDAFNLPEIDSDLFDYDKDDR